MIEARASVRLLRPAVHGGRRAIQNTAGDSLLDFSTCVSAYGSAEIVRRAAASCAIEEYPDPAAIDARRAAAATWGVNVDRVSLGSGVAELIQATATAYLEPGDRALIDTPGFGEYERAARIRDAEVVAASLDDADVFLDTIACVTPKLVFVCAPSSPIGKARDRALLQRIADACRAANSLFVLDTSYDAFSASPLGPSAFAEEDAVLTLRSLTKEFAIAGLRVGFAIGSPEIIRLIDAVRAPWSVSAPAQAAATACFSANARTHAHDAARTLRRAAVELSGAIAALGFDVLPSTTHYFVFRVCDATHATRLLADRESILVRDCASFGLPNHVRVAARLPADNARLLDALRRHAGALLP